MSSLKINLEWIPDAYTANERSEPKKETTAPGQRLVVKSTSLYDPQKLSKTRRADAN